MNVVDEEQYELVKEIQRQPSTFGITFGTQSLSGRTWLLEHTGSYGMRLYRKRVSQAEAILDRISAELGTVGTRYV